MKRRGSSESLGALISICPSTEDQNQASNHMYGREYQTMLDGLEDEGCMEECGQISEKKRRLSVDQVKALEKNFEVENKLEPERKLKLAQELGLQPRQVAVWFQNRRARWKTKQLERDYGVLKANFDALKHTFDSIQHENEALVIEIRDLKSKLKDDNTESNVSVVKQELMLTDMDDKLMEQSSTLLPPVSSSLSEPKQAATTDPNYDSYINGISKDGGGGSSDSSDSSAILNNEGNSSPNSSSSLLQCTTAPAEMNFHQFSDSKMILGDAQRAYQPQFVKIEEHNFFSGDEACNFFSDDQAPTLQWYCSDQWKLDDVDELAAD